ncbi:penicillin-binding protein 2 [uncultured Serinicoccus sp.]|uniref:penicillin-binding protein 2 n=1 Tax=uncultured Serinicoccus sp. TaxID=735514 RepID=UPI00260B8AA1|nr:penicillin-binding protein 2 [uncultured Serinicoccus sp.]
MTTHPAPRRGRAATRVPRPALTPRRVRRRRSTGALWVVLVAVLALGGLLAGRLGQMQLGQHEELAVQAAEVSTREILTPALRGRVLAADGTPVVANAASSVVTVDPQVLLESDDGGADLVASVAEALRRPEEELWGRTRLCGTEGAPPVPFCFSGSPYLPVPLVYDVDPVDALALLERPEDYPGIEVESIPVRDYPAPEGVNAAHLVGYLGRPTLEEVEASEDGLDAQAWLGRAGLEAVYDEGLRGTPGRTTLTVDPRGVVTGTLGSTDPVQGADLLTHLDVRVQAATEQALVEAVRAARRAGAPATSGAAVVLRPDTGAVLAAASFPTYDPGVWSRGVSAGEYARLLDVDRGAPLVNRVVGETYPPASTFKVVTLPAALQTGIDPEGEYSCPGAVSIAGQRFTNYESEAYGEIGLRRILEVSCDTTFYRWAYDQWRELQDAGVDDADASDRFLAVARGFGLGQRTGVDVPGEEAGTLPSRRWKQDYWESTREDVCRRAEEGYPEVRETERREFLEQLAQENCVDGARWRPGDAVNFSIGQGDVATTPLQMAVVYAAVANGGRLVTPQVADALVRPDGSVVEQIEAPDQGRVSLDEETWRIVRDGLEGVVTEGTGAAAFAGWPSADYPLAGKTGSAESFGRQATSWFASYGPADEPEYVVLVVVEEGGIGSDTAAPAVRQIWETLREVQP